jgi:tRNA (guanine-N(7)-)-methyltransferase
VIQPAKISTLAGDSTLADYPVPLPLDQLVSGDGEWEVELGFGKGKYLLQRCQGDPGTRFLGIEVASEYQGHFVERARRRKLANWVALRGDALFLLSTAVPASFASDLHVYFPDPWPKSRHHKRRLFDPQTVDLVLGLLKPGGRVHFATDFLAYGELVMEILEGYPGLEMERRATVWDGGPRTHYEAKYIKEGRPILRAEGILRRHEPRAPLHPAGARALLAATFHGDGEEDEGEPHAA